MTLRKLHHRAIFHLEEYFFIDEKRKFEFLLSCPVKMWHMYKHLLEARQTSQFRNYMGVFFLPASVGFLVSVGFWFPLAFGFQLLLTFWLLLAFGFR